MCYWLRVIAAAGAALGLGRSKHGGPGDRDNREICRGLRLGERMVMAVGFGHDDGSDLVERASAIDMMELASDVGPVPLQVGAVLVFDSGAHLAARKDRDALADRACRSDHMLTELAPLE